MSELDIEILPLSPSLSEDWLRFFDEIAFKDHGEWAFCYCLEGFLTPEKQSSWNDPHERRAAATEMIKNGDMQGYLAYHDGAVVGWCNANDREKYVYVTEMFGRVGYQPTGEKVKSVFCFLIDPAHRGKGVSHLLLDRVYRDAEKDGYTAVEAYPFSDNQYDYQYHGTFEMYTRSGFSEIADLNYVKVMHKLLL